MLCQNFLSDDVPYRTLEEAAAAGAGTWFPGGLLYNSNILGPTQYECLDRIDGLFMSSAGGAWEDSGTIILTGWTRKIAWPGWERLRWEFDAETGAFLRRDKAPGGYYAEDIYQGAGGELWLQLITGPLQLLGPDYQPTGETLIPSTYGATSFVTPLIDRARDRLVANVNVEDHIRIYRLSTGEQLGLIRMGSKPVDICHEDGSRCFVLTDDRTVYLLDYDAGRLMGAAKLPPGAALWNQGHTRMAWDKRFKRLLLCASPAQKGYAYSTAINGYRMLPVHTHLCAPIPLQRQRAGQPFRVLIRAVGDRGEGLPGLAALASTTLAGPNAAGLDGEGESVIEFTGATAGAADLTATLDTPCLS